MEKEDFKTGELKHIEPSRLIKEGVKSPIDNFFLVLAVIFNDLKGLVLFEKLIQDRYRDPLDNEVSSHSGECAGIFSQIYKIFVANIQEFFLFLKVKKDILETTEFKILLSKTNKDTQDKWKDIIDIAFDKSPKGSEFSEYLLRTRNNVSFHYYQSDKNLRKSFLNFFNKKEKMKKNDFAYYSAGENMEGTRFFYADAAIEEFLRDGTGNTKEFDMKYQKEISRIISEMNLAILRLLKIYLKNR